MNKRGDGDFWIFMCIVLALICIVIVISMNSYLLLKLYNFENGDISERKAPSDYFNASDDIIIGEKTLGGWQISNYYLMLKMDEEPMLTEYAGTGSMKPTFGKYHNGIEVKVKSEKDLYLGDVISYYDANETLIVHRIIDMDYDDDGWYAIAQGDNNKVPDSKKVRFNQIHGKLVAVIY